MKSKKVDVHSYAIQALPHLGRILKENQSNLERIVKRLVADVSQGRSLFVFGSGHSALFSFELYHRAGGASFVIPMVADFMLPSAGPSMVRVFERTSSSALPLLSRSGIKKGEMLWICSQSGINAAGVELALEAKKRGFYTVAFTSIKHSQGVESRHPSGGRLFEICDTVVDLMGEQGDAVVKVAPGLNAGPLSSLSAIFLGNSIITAAVAQLESRGIRCVYISVNTPEGEARNKSIEKRAAMRDPLLR